MATRRNALTSPTNCSSPGTGRIAATPWLDDAEDRRQHAAHDLLHREQHIGLGEALAHLGHGIVDLRPAVGNVAALDQLDHHRQMPGLTR